MLGLEVEKWDFKMRSFKAHILDSLKHNVLSLSLFVFFENCHQNGERKSEGKVTKNYPFLYPCCEMHLSPYEEWNCLTHEY